MVKRGGLGADLRVGAPKDDIQASSLTWGGASVSSQDKGPCHRREGRC